MKEIQENSELQVTDGEKNIIKSWQNRLKDKFIVFQELFIYFWICSIIGHYLEVIWAFIKHIISGAPLWQPTVPTIMPLAPPYGLGAIAVVLIVWPIIKSHKVKPLSVLALNIFTTGAIEYFCAATIVLFAGTNQFWNYSSQPFNLNGYTCLEASVLFGISATIYLYFIYPPLKKTIDKIKKRHFSFIFWLLFVTYVADLIFLYLRVKT